ncbi:hypothetical protein CYLTODRAFT_426678 [Cylindrobasidium torrendii FP15055 ss-10]|uniref:Glycosyl transferase family 25 domain-containing protein n=1 Tax=Cylindrobasidium torrendii FP15055 ss-10 TaxID=1314674 RepID=A0A0D7AWL3_9AGAR|nr:hypothetical protein CYLTODRAFT_426678 [Cylindrobasidium torrendii FP15055 ss-10]
MPRLVLSPTLPLHVPTSPRSFRRRPTFILSAVLLFLITISFVYSSKKGDVWRTPLVPSSHTYVLSLARRTDRRASMERLRKTLGLDWEYVNATEIESERVNGAYRRVQALRDVATARKLSPAGMTPPFSWPSDIDRRAMTKEDLHLRETAFWRMPAAYRETEGPLRAAERDFHLKAYETGVAEAKLLTTARVACWDTHLGVIKKIAHSELDVGIVLEDDVDMERDIKERLAGVWEALPSSWDMVFFGALSYAFAVI